MMFNKFIFHGVGQGLFYFGSIDNGNYNFVYDCGTFDYKYIKDTNEIKNKIKQDIIDGLYKQTKLDFITISHLHEDHVNLLPAIIKHLKPKGKIFLPYFPNANKYEYTFTAYLFINGIEPNTEEFQYLYEFYIGRNEGSNIQNYQNNLVFIGNDEEENNYSYNYLEIYPQNGFYWLFKFYNKKIDINIINKLNDEIEKEIKNKKKNNIEEYILENTEERKQILKTIFQNNKCEGNATSLLLLHHPIYGPATLLTGDAEFDLDLEDRIKEGIKDKCQKLDVFQVPHHGSLKNWNLISGNWKFLPRKLVFSFGWPNAFGHPSSYFYTGVKDKLLKLNQISLVYYNNDKSLSDLEKECSFEYQIHNFRHHRYVWYLDDWYLKTFD